MDVSLRESVLSLVEQATALGEVTGRVHAAGVSPSGATGADPARRPLRHRPGPRGVRHGHRRWRFGNRHRLAVGPPTARPDTRAGPGAGHVPLLAAIAADVRPATLERELAIMAETDLSEHILSRPPATCGVDARRPVPTDLDRRRMHLECTMLHSWIRARRTWRSAIGARVRQERQSRRWTLDQLAEAAGVSRRMVVNVEQGAANPSVGTLLRISDALGVGTAGVGRATSAQAGEGHPSR